MSDQTKIEWADSTFNPWVGCTKVGPGCDNCYAESIMDTWMKRVKWGAGQPRVRTSAANWRKPLQWNARPYWRCAGCGWRGDSPASDLCDEEAAGGVSIRCPICSGKLTTARRRVFCASLSDVFDNEVPIEWLCDLLDLIRRTPNLDWLLLTKRIGNWSSRLTVAHQHVVTTMGGGTAELRGHPLWDLGMWIQDWLAGKAPPNVWMGATICNQPEADRDIEKILAVPARVRFLSIEPMLSAINLPGMLYYGTERSGGCVPLRSKGYAQIDWVICGGESGPHARPMHPDWVRSLRDQCAAAGVPFLLKQHGEWLPEQFFDHSSYLGPPFDPDRIHWVWPDGRHAEIGLGEHRHNDGSVITYRVGKKAAGRTLDGRTHTEFPS